MGKKKKKPKSGTLIVIAEPVSEEKLTEIKKVLDDIPVDYDIVVTKDNTVELKTSFFGPCPWCSEIIYTQDTCPQCGKLVDLS